MSEPIDRAFRARYRCDETSRPDDARDEYQRDRSRVIHSSAFRRLQAKTQVMGIGEGDFHRTRLTHSIEVAQIGESILLVLARNHAGDAAIADWLPSRDLLTCACLSHDLGHPPFGHGGEIALQNRMAAFGGFEANAQTLRIVTRLEKYTRDNGMNPTRRSILAILKYPAPYSAFAADGARDKPPKCHYDADREIVDWALADPFETGDAEKFVTERSAGGQPRHRSFDCSIMELADDIAYAVHDLEDIVARGMVLKDELLEHIRTIYGKHGNSVGERKKAVSVADFEDNLFAGSDRRKPFIGKLVNLFITSVRVKETEGFAHPLLKYRVGYDDSVHALLDELKDLTHDLVIRRPEIQQLVRRGQRIVDSLFEEFIRSPIDLVPGNIRPYHGESHATERRISDYIAGMTDSYAEKIYGRLFIPGQGSSTDEL